MAQLTSRASVKPTDPAQDAPKYSSSDKMVAAKLPDMVKGYGYAHVGGVEPLDDQREIFSRSADASKALRKTVARSYRDPGSIRKSLNPSFAEHFGLFLANSPVSQQLQGFVADLNRILSTELGRNFTLTSPLSTGFVPFDLVAPTRLLHPVYSPLRNKIPRTPGQGTSRRAKLITGVQGSQTGGSSGAAKRVSISELNGGNFSNYPITLPAAGAANALDLNVPYAFFGITEALSWLAQFSGQGFEDVSALANLILLQEAMLAEEYQIIAGTSTAVSQPSAPTVTARTAGSNETQFTAGTYFVVVTATTYFGETAYASGNASTSTVVAAGQVADITIAGQPSGVVSYNVYVGTSNSRTSLWLQATGVGGTKFTLQGTAASSGTNPPASDTGTSASTDYEGMFSILSGHAPTSQYPSGVSGAGNAGYFKANVGDTLNTNVVYTALKALWDSSAAASGPSVPGGYRADPAELIAEGSDMATFGQSILSNQGGVGAYQFIINQSEAGNLTGGAAISQFINPITRSQIKLLVHPWFPQGTSILMSYTLPMSWSNVSNVWENVMVQDYLSISWPVIDMTFRYSIFWFGALVCYAPMYNALLQGIQRSNTTPYS